MPSLSNCAADTANACTLAIIWAAVYSLYCPMCDYIVFGHFAISTAGDDESFSSVSADLDFVSSYPGSNLAHY